MFRTVGGVAALLLLLGGCPKPTGSETPQNPDEPARRPLSKTPITVEADLASPERGHDPSAKSKLLDIMARENARWMEELKHQPKAPAYFLAYTIHEKKVVALEAESGALTLDEDETQRALDVEVRVGSPELDNRRPLRDPQLAQFNSLQHLGRVPRGEDPKAIAHHLWLETDRRYREAALMLRLVQTQEQVSTDSDTPPDFSHQEPETHIQQIADLPWDREIWDRRVRACSKKARQGVATRGTCRVDAELNTIYYVNSEGSTIQKSWTSARLVVSVGVKADDGMPLARMEQEFARVPQNLPDEKRVDELLTLINKDLDALHEAPVVDPWAGPAILEGRAAAVFFHEVFGHRIEGHRQKEKQFGKTFTKAVGKRIMPRWLSVYDDPRLRTLNGKTLNGFYQYDDEGVRAQRADLVDSGVLKGFIMSRTPIEGFGKSNGHGRSETGRNAVSRQGNLVVQAARSVEREDLYARLVDEVKRQGKEYGMVFTDISGGFTNTSTFLPQAFKVEPIMAYRVFKDGRKELVRGVDISGSPLTALDNILAAAGPMETFNGMCGAESGWVPVSASAPSLLIETLEVERGFEPSDRNPVLQPPPSLKAEVLR